MYFLFAVGFIIFLKWNWIRFDKSFSSRVAQEKSLIFLFVCGLMGDLSTKTKKIFFEKWNIFLMDSNQGSLQI
jgi:hypothetical protein